MNCEIGNDILFEIEEVTRFKPNGRSKAKSMEFSTTNIPEVLLISPTIFRDQRGEFLETYRSAEFAAAGIDLEFVQDNHAGSKSGVLRGLHYQIQQAQGKLIRVVSGEIFDVAVDLRKNSPTFSQSVGIRLSDQEKKQLWIPPGFAHGYYVLSDWAEVSYKVTSCARMGTNTIME